MEEDIIQEKNMIFTVNLDITILGLICFMPKVFSSISARSYDTPCEKRRKYAELWSNRQVTRAKYRTSQEIVKIGNLTVDTKTVIVNNLRPRCVIPILVREVN